MKTAGSAIFAAALVSIPLLAAPALADRSPSRQEATAIAAKLTAEGYQSWDKIKYDKDGPKWEVDNARTIDGKTYDLDLSPTDYGIIKRESD